MDYVLIGLTALTVAMLSFFSGFGVGTMLMPVFAIFFPIEIAIAATAIVHLANNIFKLGLVGRHADWRVVALFATPAAAAAILGASSLSFAASLPSLPPWRLGRITLHPSWIKLAIGLFIIGFALFDLASAAHRITYSLKRLPIGGLLSGFFGGLSGHQGALRTAYLIKLGLSKESFIGTSAASAIVIDITRLTVYGLTFLSSSFDIASGQRSHLLRIVITGALCAFGGSFIGSKLLQKVTLRMVRAFVGAALIAMGVALAAGVI